MILIAHGSVSFVISISKKRSVMLVASPGRNGRISLIPIASKMSQGFRAAVTSACCVILGVRYV